MELEDLIKKLIKVETGDPELDRCIGQFAGWSRASETSSKQGAEGEYTRETEKWQAPGTLQLMQLPSFSADLQAALDLVSTIAPGEAVGASWGGSDLAHSNIGTGLVVHAATPMLALCAAAMLRVRKFPTPEDTASLDI